MWPYAAFILNFYIGYWLIGIQVRKGHSMIYQHDIIEVLDKQLLEGMGVLLTEEEQQKCEQSVSFDMVPSFYLVLVILAC